MNKKKLVIFDEESLPNFFCLVASPIDSDQLVRYEISSRKSQHQEIIALAEHYELVGYNSAEYDDILLQFIIDNPNCTAQEINFISQAIITRYHDVYRRYKNKISFSRRDILPMLASSKLRVSLKHLQVVIKWPNVEEFECDWTKDLPEERWDDCLSYCDNDVLSLKAVCKTLTKDFELRDYVYETTGQNAYSKDPVKIAEYAMCEAIAKGLGLETEQFIWDQTASNKANPLKRLVIKDLLLPFISFKTERFKEVLSVYQNLVIVPEEEAAKKDDDKFGYPIRFNNMWLVFGLGGLHHNYGKKTGNKKFKPKGVTHKEESGSQLLMPDVGSYYPSQRIKLGYTHQFDPYFLEEYSLAYTEKAVAKREKNKMLEAYAKLKMNSVYGLYNSVYSPLYQPEVSYSTAINGQLMLAMLIESFDLNGIQVLGTNTDSITVRLRDDHKELYQKLCKEWEDITKMKLDHDEFKAIYEQSCNNYIAVMPDGKVKAKGFFVDEVNLLKGYSYPVVKKALIAYFTKGVEVEKFLFEHEDIYDFCMSTRMGTAKNGNKFEAYHNGEKLQRTNRYFASHTGAYLYKSSDRMNMEHVLKDSGVTIFNKYVKKEMKDYGINYSFYERVCRKIINEIEPKQLNLFG